MRAFPVALLLLALAGCESAVQNPGGQGQAQAVVPESAPQCRTHRLDADVARQRIRDDGSVEARLRLTNLGPDTCTLAGRPGLALEAGGATVAPPARALPGDTTTLTLVAGQSAFADLHWTPCAPTDPACPSGDQVLVGAPGDDLAPASLEGFSLQDRKQLGISGLQIGPVRR